MGRFYHASDYAGLAGGRFAFYFGYEKTSGEGEDEEWCFVATKDDTEVFRATQSQIGWEGGQPTEWGVLAGIACFLDHYPKRSPD